MSNEISLVGIDKAAALAALYNASAPKGLGWFEASNETMTRDVAKELLKGQTYFDYLQGRVMKVDLSGDSMRVGSYDRDNGQGAAERALAPLIVKSTA